MRPGFWQLVFFVGLFLFFFGAPLLRFIRFCAREKEEKERERPPEKRAPRHGRPAARDDVVDAEVVQETKR